MSNLLGFLFENVDIIPNSLIQREMLHFTRLEKRTTIMNIIAFGIVVLDYKVPELPNANL